MLIKIDVFAVVNFDALAQASELKGDTLFSSAECRVSETESPADWMPANKPTELSRIKLKNLNSIARSYDQQTSNQPHPTAGWLSQLAVAIYMFAVVNFDALAQASNFQIERRHLVSSRLNAHWQNNWAIEDQTNNTRTLTPEASISGRDK